MTAEERLRLIRVKVERAKKHLADLEAEIQTFKDSDPYTIQVEREQQTGHSIHRLASVSEIPTVVTAITGDTLYNLRAALDHLAYQLAIANGTSDEGVLKRTYFPIFDSAARYHADKGRKVEGM